ncbi:MAG: DUF2264 domain-containing protein [Propionibacteriaceae bacterium]|nr:DUF2264 domain-containing protein [Propionibacteriaceae bacterium]
MARPDALDRTNPPSDRDLSPYSGYTREHWAAIADAMLLAMRPHFSPDRAGFRLAGRTSHYGPDSDALEGFARSLLLASARLAGEGGDDPHGFAEFYAAGLAAGVTPGRPTSWPRIDVVGQAKVEAAVLCLALHLSRPWLWDRLDDATRQRFVDWLAPTRTEEYPPMNWAWFQLMGQGFLASVGADFNAERVSWGLGVHESCYRGGGWYADGTERAYDHYNGWAFHTLPLLWAEVAPHLCPDDLRAAWRARLSEFLHDGVHLIGGNGAPMIQGRSLLYRFAAAAPLWVGALTGATDLPPGLLRRGASGMLTYFVDAGAIDERGLVPLGFHGEYLPMLQDYSGPGSPYWVSLGMLGLALPADHAVWTAREEPLPVETGDFLRPVAAPGWLLSGTASDGIVRLVNHGTDHAHAGDVVTDAPLYAHLAYSTHTFPVLDAGPADNAVVLRDAAGRPSHRTGFQALRCDVADGVGVGISRGVVHWIDQADDDHDHGSGRRGVVSAGPEVTLMSVVRDGDEVRVALVGPESAASVSRVDFLGWPGGRGVPTEVVPLRGLSESSVSAPGEGPMGEFTVRSCAGPGAVDGVYAALVRLGDAVGRAAPTLEVDAEAVEVTWPDGRCVRVTIP